MCLQKYRKSLNDANIQKNISSLFEEMSTKLWYRQVLWLCPMAGNYCCMTCILFLHRTGEQPSFAVKVLVK